MGSCSLPLPAGQAPAVLQPQAAAAGTHSCSRARVCANFVGGYAAAPLDRALACACACLGWHLAPPVPSAILRSIPSAVDLGRLPLACRPRAGWVGLSQFFE